MGRPINKKFFGTGAGNQIKTRFKDGGSEYDGYILSQRSATRFKVTDGSVEAVCKLADKLQKFQDTELLLTLANRSYGHLTMQVMTVLVKLKKKAQTTSNKICDCFYETRNPAYVGFFNQQHNEDL